MQAAQMHAQANLIQLSIDAECMCMYIKRVAAVFVSFISTMQLA